MILSDSWLRRMNHLQGFLRSLIDSLRGPSLGNHEFKLMKYVYITVFQVRSWTMATSNPHKQQAFTQERHFPPTREQGSVVRIVPCERFRGGLGLGFPQVQTTKSFRLALGVLLNWPQPGLCLGHPGLRFPSRDSVLQNPDVFFPNGNQQGMGLLFTCPNPCFGDFCSWGLNLRLIRIQLESQPGFGLKPEGFET